MYYRLKIELNRGPLEGIANLAFEWGALGLEEREQKLEVFFQGAERVEQFESALAVYLKDYEQLEQVELRWSVTREELPDLNWNETWQQNWTATAVGSFIVHPPWGEPEAPADATLLTINPGMAFGTGTHPTTRLLLKWIGDDDFSKRNLLDVGCGSGILAIAAVKRSAAFVMGIDIEPEAIENARENARLNDVAHETFFRLLEPARLEEMYHFSLVMANMIYPRIAAVFPDLVRLTEPEGELWLSGLLISDLEKLAELIGDYPLDELERSSEGEWAAVRYRRRNEDATR